MTITGRPRLDIATHLAWAETLPPVERVAGLDAIRQDLLDAIGLLTEPRRAAVAEAIAAGSADQLGVGSETLRKAALPDRELLRGALEILTRPGVCTMSAEVAKGLGARADLGVMARRVDIGMSHLNDTSGIGEADWATLHTASARTAQLLGPTS